MTRPISALDVPLSEVQAEAERLWAERDRRVAALNFRHAAERTNSPSDRLAFYLDARLVRDQAPVSVDADYPEWAAELATRPTYHHARKEGC